MTDSPNFGFMPRTVCSDIQSKWMARWTDLHNALHSAGYCLDPEFHAHDHVACPEALTDVFTMCDKIHGEGSAESAKAQLDWQCCYKAKKGTMFSLETPPGQMQQRWVEIQSAGEWAARMSYRSGAAHPLDSARSASGRQLPGARSSRGRRSLGNPGQGRGPAAADAGR